MTVHTSLTFIAMVAVVALLCGMALTRLRQPAIVGYIVAGVVLGPSGFGLVEDRAQINVLAELGVLMLLFLIGMEVSLRAFRSVLGIALLGAALQVAVSVGVMLLLSLVLGWPVGLALLLGFVVAISSTAVAIKILDDIGELRTQVGRRAVGVLIAQDLAVVPMMLVLNAMASEAGLGVGSILLMAASMGFLVPFVWYLSRRQRLRLPLSGWAVRDRDLTPLAALAYCFAAATITGLIGLSAAYGAFLAGLLLGSSTDRRAMIRATRPIQSVLLMVFFLSIGLLIDLDYIWRHLGSILVLLIFVTLGKTAMNVGILRLVGEPWPRAFLIGVVLGQIGEFSFVLAALGLSNGLIPAADHRLVVAVIALSLVIGPLWLDVARRLRDLAAAGISTANELLGELYPDAAAALRDRAGEAAHGARRLGAAIEPRARRLAARWRRPPPAPAGDSPGANPGGANPEKPALGPPAGEGDA